MQIFWFFRPFYLRRMGDFGLGTGMWKGDGVYSPNLSMLGMMRTIQWILVLVLELNIFMGERKKNKNKKGRTRVFIFQVRNTYASFIAPTFWSLSARQGLIPPPKSSIKGTQKGS